jgi:hypothetical protein
MRYKGCCVSLNSRLPCLPRLVRPLPLGLSILASLASPACMAAPVVAADAVVYAAGDIAACRGRAPQFAVATLTAQRIEADLAGQALPAAVLTLGDNTYPVGKLAEFTDCYGPTWGRFKAITYPSPGNHEYAGGLAKGYFTYFGARAAKGYYSFALGSWHLVSLDSNLKGEAFQAQLDWLRADLAASGARCTLAYWHHPLYSSGGHGSMATMRAAWQLLQAAGAELVLSSHDHDYERFAPQDADGGLDAAGGMRQFVVGTGGAQLTPFLLTENHSEKRDNSRMGVLKLTLSQGAYAWEFLEASYDGYGQPPAPDRGNGLCH